MHIFELYLNFQQKSYFNSQFDLQYDNCRTIKLLLHMNTIVE